MLRLPDPVLLVLVGPSGAGKSSWAAEQFRAEQVVSTDGLRALVGEHEHDQRAGTDAFALLDDILARRLARRLTTVIDSTGLSVDHRRRWVETARRHELAVHAVVFDTPPAVCRARNRQRERPVPSAVLTAQLKAAATVDAALAGEGFDGVHRPEPVRLVPASMAATAAAAAAQASDPVSLSFGLQIPRFNFAGAPEATAVSHTDVARAAEDAGFESLWVMDHFVQIPQVGAEWEDMLESYTTLGFLAAATSRIRLGALVTGVTYRNLAHLAKIVSTLDVLSGGRANCGLGAAWFEREHQLYGWELPPLRRRYELLEDALRLLPLMWGKGSPAFAGSTTSVPAAICYPRPIQDHIPILVGGSGERKTLRLVARHADACNLFGDDETVRHKVAVLARHCEDEGRDRADITVTHLSTALTAADAPTLARLVEDHRPRTITPERFAAAAGAGTVDEQIGRYRRLAEAGVHTAIINLPTAPTVDSVSEMAAVIDAFSG